MFAAKGVKKSHGCSSIFEVTKNTNAMGYFTLTLSSEEQTRKYTLFYAHYLKEAWLAEVHYDGTTKIVKEYKCKDFRRCFRSAASLIRSIGTVKAVAAHDVDQANHEAFLSELKKSAPPVPTFPVFDGLSRLLQGKNVRSWLADTLPNIYPAH